MLHLIILNRQVKKILTDEVISIIKPKRMFVLCKGESFYKVNSKDKKSTKRICFVLRIEYFFVFFNIYC